MISSFLINLSYFQKAFKNKKFSRVSCWFHLTKNVEKKLRKLRLQGKLTRGKSRVLLRDLHDLQLSSSPEIFEIASDLYIKKHEDAPEFIEWFTKVSNLLSLEHYGLSNH